MLGFNRRFSPHITKTSEILRDRIGPVMLYYRVNAGRLPAEHWVHSSEGGGRVIGEGCHFIDLISYLISSEVENYSVYTVAPREFSMPVNSNFIVTMEYRDGSAANLFYTSLGSKAFPKEYIEMFFDNSVITVDSFRNWRMSGTKERAFQTKKEEKGHLEELEYLAQRLRKWDKSHAGLQDYIQTTKMTLDIEQKLKHIQKA
jgi:predicted dehydrogenase